MPKKSESANLVRETLVTKPDISYEDMSDVLATHGLAMKKPYFYVLRNKSKKKLSSLPSLASLTAPVQEVPLILKEYVPAIDPTFVIDEDFETLFKLIEAQSKTLQQNVLLTGPSGCGKTTTAREYAARLGRPLLIMNCANVREPRDWFGYRTIDPISKGIVWVESLFSRMAQTDRAVIVLDEINRVSPLVINALMGLTDPSCRETFLEEAGKKIRVAGEVVFFATMNEGSEYTGTIGIDKAMQNRFRRTVECTFLAQGEETKLLHRRTGLEMESCKKLAAVAAEVRKKAMSHVSDSFSSPISTRQLVGAAQDMVTGGPVTLKWSLLNHFPNDTGARSERSQLMQLLIGKFGNVFAKKAA